MNDSHAYLLCEKRLFTTHLTLTSFIIVPAKSDPKLLKHTAHTIWQTSDRYMEKHVSHVHSRSHVASTPYSPATPSNSLRCGEGKNQSSKMTNPSHSRTQSLLLINKILDCRDNVSPFTLVVDSLEQPAGPVVDEVLRRAAVSAFCFLYLLAMSDIEKMRKSPCSSWLLWLARNITSPP